MSFIYGSIVIWDINTGSNPVRTLKLSYLFFSFYFLDVVIAIATSFTYKKGVIKIKVSEFIDDLKKLKQDSEVIITCKNCNHGNAWWGNSKPTIKTNHMNDTFSYIEIIILEKEG